MKQTVLAATLWSTKDGCNFNRAFEPHKKIEAVREIGREISV